MGHHHDDVIKCKHFLRYSPFVRGIHWPWLDSPHKGQWCRALIFSMTRAWKTVEQTIQTHTQTQTQTQTQTWFIQRKVIKIQNVSGHQYMKWTYAQWKGKGRHRDSPIVFAENRGGISAATGSDITVTTFPLQCIQWCVTDLLVTQLDMLGDLH